MAHHIIPHHSRNPDNDDYADHPIPAAKQDLQSGDQGQAQLQTQGRKDARPDTDRPGPVAAAGDYPLLKCGPLLRYCGTDYDIEAERQDRLPVWRGTVLLIMGAESENIAIPEIFYTGSVVEGNHNNSNGEYGNGYPQDEGIGMAVTGDAPYRNEGSLQQGNGFLGAQNPQYPTPSLAPTSPGSMYDDPARPGLAMTLSSYEGHQNINQRQYGLDEANPFTSSTAQPQQQQQYGQQSQYSQEQQQQQQTYRNPAKHDKTTTDDQGRTRSLEKASYKILLHEDNTLFVRYHIEVTLEHHERTVDYFIHGVSGGPRDTLAEQGPKLPEGQMKREFNVPGATDSMRIMFHSCNGFSVGTNEEAFAGPALWHDVVRIHKSHPFHVMIGGGDQIYNDAIRVSGPLKDWANMKDPRKRRRTQYTPELSRSVNNWYRENYLQWYSTPPFSTMNARIPQVNIWDDHDIIDGYGSYTDHFMRAPVFLGIGRAAWRYYMLFQHHTPPDGEKGEEERSWIISRQEGPYIGEKSRHIYARLGRRIAFLGMDARTERTRHQIAPESTYDDIFDRMEAELTNQRSNPNGEINHLLLLLGVPIAYPRLVWLETILKNPLWGGLRFLNKRFGLAGGLFNKFDGAVDLLDDLDDHWCAAVHKKERNIFLRRLQDFSRRHSVRITMLSGDVHLAAIGRFWSADKSIPVRQDFRYMPNVISSAITNKPPPPAISKVLAKRNKVHHLDEHTDEQLLEFFDEDMQGKPRANKVTMPRRNFAILSESLEGPPVDDPNHPDADKLPTEGDIDKEKHVPGLLSRIVHPTKAQTLTVLGPGEKGAGVSHPGARAEMAEPPVPVGGLEQEGVDNEAGDGRGHNGHNGGQPQGERRWGERFSDNDDVPDKGQDASARTGKGALNVAIRVEREKGGKEGRTRGYGFAVPVLRCN